MPDPVVDPAVTPPAAPTWHAGLTADEVGHLRNRGWDALPADKAAAAIYQSYRHAESLIGGPPDKTLRIPEQNDEAGWRDVYTKLGVPADPKDYDFSSVKFADGKDVPAEFQDFSRQLAASLKLPKDAAARLATEIVRFDEKTAASETVARTAGLEVARAALRQNWGPNYESNEFIAKQAAAKLGVTPEQLNALESVQGYDKVMELFRKVGEGMGEDKFVANRDGKSGATTLEQAVSQKAELKNDEAFVKRFLDGNAEAVRQMQALDTIIAAARTAA